MRGPRIYLLDVEEVDTHRQEECGDEPPSLYFRESAFVECMVQLFGHGPAVLQPALAAHLDQPFLIQEDQQIGFRGKLPLRRSDIQTVQSLSVRITFGAVDDLSEAINKAVTTFMGVTGVPDFRPIGDSYPWFFCCAFGFVFIEHNNLDVES